MGFYNFRLIAVTLFIVMSPGNFHATSLALINCRNKHADNLSLFLSTAHVEDGDRAPRNLINPALNKINCQLHALVT